MVIGVLWYGMWCHVVWYWSGVVWYDTGVMYCDMVWCGMMLCLVWHGMVINCTVTT